MATVITFRILGGFIIRLCTFTYSDLISIYAWLWPCQYASSRFSQIFLLVDLNSIIFLVSLLSFNLFTCANHISCFLCIFSQIVNFNSIISLISPFFILCYFYILQNPLNVSIFPTDNFLFSISASLKVFDPYPKIHFTMVLSK